MDGESTGGNGTGGSGTDSPAVTNPSDVTDGDSGAAGAESNPSNDDAVGGSTPSALGDCSEPYVGPVGGPRKDGPESIIAPCDAISDEVILARYQSEDLRVPRGLYWEPPGLVSTWEEPCSSSLSDTVGRAAAAGLLEPENQTSSDWSHEVSACHEATRRFYSNLNCDYWLFAGQTVQGMLHFASVLWWIEHGQTPGNAIVGYYLRADSGSGADLCTVRTLFGEPGVCDEITVERTYYFTQVSGLPIWGSPVVVRTLRGYCD